MGKKTFRQFHARNTSVPGQFFTISVRVIWPPMVPFFHQYSFKYRPFCIDASCKAAGSSTDND